jgi:hypothetical protein
VLLDAADAGWESGQVGRTNNLLKEARQSACSESEPGRVDHYMEGLKPDRVGGSAWTRPLRGKIKNPSRALEEDLVSL